MRKLAIVFKAIAGVTAMLGSVHSAQAETITVDGVYEARAQLPDDLELLLIDRFRGDLGPGLEIALAERLGYIFIRGEPYFDLITPNALRNVVVEVEGNDGTVSTRPITPDAELRGSLRSEVIEREVDPKIERECAKRDEDDKCVERREVRIECRKLTVRVDPRILLVGANGERLYSENQPRESTERFCADQNGVPSSLELENDLVNALADDIRLDLAPIQSRSDIRVMERRKGLRKDDRRPFRDAVKATKSDVNAACDAFEALEATNPDHLSILFNIGLCHESVGELDAALEYYRRALTIDPGRDYPQDAMRRVRSRISAEEHLAERAAL